MHAKAAQIRRYTATAEHQQKRTIQRKCKSLHSRNGTITVHVRHHKHVCAKSSSKSHTQARAAKVLGNITRRRLLECAAVAASCASEGRRVCRADAIEDEGDQAGRESSAAATPPPMSDALTSFMRYAMMSRLVRHASSCASEVGASG